MASSLVTSLVSAVGAARRPVLRGAAAALCAGAVALGATGAAHAYPGPSHRQYTADQAHRFLTAFYHQHGPTVAQRASQTTPQLRTAIAAQKAYDLLVCARQVPANILVGPVSPATNGRAKATITTVFANRQAARHTGKGAAGHTTRPGGHWGGTAGGTHPTSARFTAYVSLDARSPMRVTEIKCGSMR
jgi:hypothetical protein